MDFDNDYGDGDDGGDDANDAIFCGDVAAFIVKGTKNRRLVGWLVDAYPYPLLAIRWDGATHYDTQKSLCIEKS